MKAFEAWYRDLKRLKKYSGLPAKGTVGAALVVLERLRTRAELDISGHLAEGGAQIAGLTKASLRKILNHHGEGRPFLTEGGRTNRGNNAPVASLLAALDQGGFARMRKEQRSFAIDRMQEFLVRLVDAYYNLERLRFDYDASKPLREVVADILQAAHNRNQSGPVAQHLVGAKLALRFPHISVTNFPYSAADDQAGRAGDFLVGDTAFHVTVAPSLGHVGRCARNVHDGLNTFLLVPDTRTGAVKALLETSALDKKVAVESVESFVGQNITEMAEFESHRLASMLGSLLREYNIRVNEVENDSSLLIQIPSSLKGDD